MDGQMDACMVGMKAKSMVAGQEVNSKDVHRINDSWTAWTQGWMERK